MLKQLKLPSEFIVFFLKMPCSMGTFDRNQYAAAAAAKSLQSCLTLCDPIDGSPPGSSAHGVFQARVLEWGAIAFSEKPVWYTLKDTAS